MDSLEDDFLDATSSEAPGFAAGPLLARVGRPLAAAAAASLVGGLLLAWLMGGASEPPASASNAVEIAGDADVRPPQNPASQPAAGTRRPLARLRGPVGVDASGARKPDPALAPDTSLVQKSPVAPATAAPTPSEVRFELELDEFDDDEVVTEEDMVDMRPAAMRPDAGGADASF